MKKINMRYNKRIQNFVNRFEIIVAELNWNESTICFSFKKKLISNLLNVIHLLHSREWFEIFVRFKKLAHETENHIKIDNKMQEERDEQKSSKKRIKFFENRKSFFRQISDNQRIEAQKQKKNVNMKWISQQQIEFATRKKFRRKRENNLCLNCENKNHWVENSKCQNQAFMKSRIESKNQ